MNSSHIVWTMATMTAAATTTMTTTTTVMGTTTTVTTTTPCLVADLRIALSVLYALPILGPGFSSTSRPSPQQAHEYLLHFQSRNGRRKLNSSSSQRTNNNNQSIDLGSTWLACLHVLLSFSAEQTGSCQIGRHEGDPSIPKSHSSVPPPPPPIHYAEALFAAQTLVHRLRRVSLTEAIDVELEDVLPSTTMHQPLQQQQVGSLYKQWVGSRIGSFPWLVERQESSGVLEGNSLPDFLEERIKGEVSMMVVAFIVDRLTKTAYHHRHSSLDDPTASIRSLLTTCAYAMAVIAARMRYRPASLPDPAPDIPSIVEMILGCLQAVHQQHPPIHEQRQQQQQHYHQHQAEAFLALYFTCLTALPEAILTGSAGRDGGAFGRFSLEPRCYTAVTTELKTDGILQVWQSTQGLLATRDSISCISTASTFLLKMTESWVRYVPLPLDFVMVVVPLVQQTWLGILERAKHSRSLPNSNVAATAKVAFDFWIGIMDAGAWSVDEILTASLIQGKDSRQQGNKKRQSSKSKKRQEQVLEERSNENMMLLAQNEAQYRRNVACEVARVTINDIQNFLQYELDRANDSEENFIQGDGPVGAIAACANTCLPHLITVSGKDESRLFVALSHSMQKVSAHSSRHVRYFSFESINQLYDTLKYKDNSSVNANLRNVAINHCAVSALNLASACKYPDGYFDVANLTCLNDEDLENERNDVRDLLRTVGSEEKALLQLLHALGEPIRNALVAQSINQFPESALHAFSALAKPVNSAVRKMVVGIDEIVRLTTEILTASGNVILLGFSTASVEEVFPLSRLYNLAVASLSPFLAFLAETWGDDPSFIELMRIAIDAAGLSLLRLAELWGPSTLRSSRYDIRGAMRSPGGEDHVGVLALLRLTTEGDALTRAFLRAKESIVSDLCSLYEELRKMEEQRGPGVLYGSGVLPKSRRLLLGVISSLDGSSSFLATLFQSTQDSVCSFARRPDHPSTESLNLICEATFDIASLPSFAYSLFNQGPNSQEALVVLAQMGNFGFYIAADPDVAQETLIQWNRLRAALFTLCKVLGSADLPPAVVAMMTSWIKEECEAALAHCALGSSRIFQEDLICDETVPTGIFLMTLCHSFDGLLVGTPVSTMKNALHVLHRSRTIVLQTITNLSPPPTAKSSFKDPRPTIAETWLLCIIKLMKAAIRLHAEGEETAFLQDVFVESCVAVTCLLHFQSLGKTQEQRSDQQGMSLDGPCGLLIFQFYEAFFHLGPGMLQMASRQLVIVIPIETVADSHSLGGGIIGAAFLRSAQGGMPPWAIESIPSVWAAWYFALDNIPAQFRLMLDLSMSVRLAGDFGSIRRGQLLAGGSIEKMKDSSRQSLLDQAEQLASSDTIAGWRNLKTLIKQACGGKKKETDYNQKPALTRFESLDRL